MINFILTIWTLKPEKGSHNYPLCKHLINNKIKKIGLKEFKGRGFKPFNYL